MLSKAFSRARYLSVPLSTLPHEVPECENVVDAFHYWSESCLLFP